MLGPGGASRPGVVRGCSIINTGVILGKLRSGLLTLTHHNSASGEFPWLLSSYSGPGMKWQTFPKLRTQSVQNPVGESKYYIWKCPLRQYSPCLFLLIVCLPMDGYCQLPLEGAVSLLVFFSPSRLRTPGATY